MKNFTILLTALLLFTQIINPRRVVALERLEPATGCYAGLLVADGESPLEVSSRIGFTPATFTRFYAFPFDAPLRQSVQEFCAEVRTSGGIAVITLEPFGGLSAVTAAQCNDFADLCAEQEALGIGGIMVRFAHEMNGNWYAWGQQPTLYRQTFQLLATAVHSRTTRTAMVWSPNNGIGYPFGTGAFSPAPGSPNFVELDTNSDGSLTSADDMFGPFYPGDGYVDWVGITAYHWGVSYPWLENELPTPHEFAGLINAAGPGVPADYSRWFYARFCSDGVHNKPLMIAETSAFYNTEQPGANELAIKQGWFRQLYNISGSTTDGPDVSITFPKMKCVNWFDHYKREGEAQNQFVDWRATAHLPVRHAFINALRAQKNGQNYFLSAYDFHLRQDANSIAPANLPAILPLSGSIDGALTVKAASACDLVVDLLDDNFNYQGGTRIPVAAGTSNIPFSVSLLQSLSDGQRYRWSIFLTPTGGTFNNLIVRYNGPKAVARAVAPYVDIQSAPITAAAGTTITTRVKYVAETDSVLTVSLLNASQVSRGAGTVSVRPGSGAFDLNVTQFAGNAAGAYTLRATLSNPGIVAESPALPIQLAVLPSSNSVALTVLPSVVKVGEVFRFKAAYASTGTRDLRLELFNPAGTLIGTVVQPVALGSNSLDLTISQPLATAGLHTARAHLVPTGGTAAQAVVSSTVESLHVVRSSYINWTEDYWGTVLVNDPIAPIIDVDGDGRNNSDEFVMLTDPRDAGSVMRPTFTRVGNLMTISWPTVVGRNYQVFAKPILGAGTWSAVNATAAGTGNVMSYNFNLSSAAAANYYRVQTTTP